MKNLVLVHGAWHGAWCWEPTLTALAERGITAQAIELPFDGLDADATSVAAALDDLPGEKVVLGHSYGGMVVSQAVAGRDDVSHLVYLCALMLEVGEEALSLFSSDPEAAAIFESADIDPETGISTFRSDRAADVFYNDCDADQASWATARLRPFPTASLGGVTGEPWRRVESTYVLCSEDRTVPPGLQRRMSTRAGQVVEWPTSHSPFLSRPDLLAALLEPLLRD